MFASLVGPFGFYFVSVLPAQLVEIGSRLFFQRRGR